MYYVYALPTLPLIQITSPPRRRLPDQEISRLVHPAPVTCQVTRQDTAQVADERRLAHTTSPSQDAAAARALLLLPRLPLRRMYCSVDHSTSECEPFRSVGG
jgi:hypothetical protein